MKTNTEAHKTAGSSAQKLKLGEQDTEEATEDEKTIIGSHVCMHHTPAIHMEVSE